MLRFIRDALAEHHAVILEAEEIAAHGGREGLMLAAARATDPFMPRETRLYHERVAILAIRRRRDLEFADRGTKDDIMNRWRMRRGSRVR